MYCHTYCFNLNALDCWLKNEPYGLTHQSNSILKIHSNNWTSIDYDLFIFAPRVFYPFKNAQLAAMQGYEKYITQNMPTQEVLAHWRTDRRYATLLIAFI